LSVQYEKQFVLAGAVVRRDCIIDLLLSYHPVKVHIAVLIKFLKVI
jgi:hypothetical protein